MPTKENPAILKPVKVRKKSLILIGKENMFSKILAAVFALRILNKLSVYSVSIEVLYNNKQQTEVSYFRLLYLNRSETLVYFD